MLECFRHCVLKDKSGSLYRLRYFIEWRAKSGCHWLGPAWLWDRPLHHDARMHLRPPYRAREQPLDREEAVLVVEERRFEVFPLLATQPQPEKRTACGWVPDRWPRFADPSLQNAQRSSNGSIVPRPVSPVGRGDRASGQCTHAWAGLHHDTSFITSSQVRCLIWAPGPNQAASRRWSLLRARR